MSEENSKETPQPKTKVTPLSVVSMGPLNALIFRKDIEQNGAMFSETFVNIKRNPTNTGDEPNAIPIMEIPALVMLLKAVAEPAMHAREIKPPDPQGTLDASVSSNRKTRRKAGKK